MAGLRRGKRTSRGDATLENHSTLRRLPGLHDVALVVSPGGGLARPERADAPLSAADLVNLVRQAGGADCDIRILTIPGPDGLAMLQAAARQLGRDILVPPPGSELVRVPTSAPELLGSGPDRDADPDDAAGAREDLVPVDATTGHPVEWLAIQPSGQLGNAFGWHELIGGLILPRHGLVAVPLPDGGRILATHQSFVAQRAAAAALRAGHPALITIGVGVRGGDFVLGFYDRPTAIVDGADLAAELADVPLYNANLRLWLSWPRDEAERQRMRANMSQLSEVTGATVWVPDEPGAAVILGACLDLAAIGPDGQPTRWRAYGQPGPFESDVDGRLVPIGGVAVDRRHGIGLASGDQRRDTWADVRSGFLCDLPILADGRIGMRYGDGTLLALGPRQFQQSLRDAGWDGGEEIVLVSPVTPTQAAATRRHLDYLAAHLGVPITLAADGIWPGHPARPQPSSPPPAEPVPPQPAPPQVAPPPPADPAPPQPARLRQGPPAPADPAPPQPAPPPPDPASTGERSLSNGYVPAIDELLSIEARLPAGQTDSFVPTYPRAEANALLRDLDAGQPAEAARLHRLASTMADHLVAERDVAAADPLHRAEQLLKLAELTDHMTELVTEPVGAGRPGPGADSRWASAADTASGPGQHLASNRGPYEPDDDADDPFAAPIRRSRLIDGPRLEPSPPGPRHGLSWLPTQPQTNAEPVDLYVPCDPDPFSALTEGVPSPALFLPGHLDRDRLAATTTAAHLIQVRVDVGGAVDVEASDVVPPSEVADLLDDSDVYALPAGWLFRSHVVATYRITRTGETVRQSRHDSVPLLLATTGARHGVAGLPVEAVGWPRGRFRGAVTRYLVAPRTGGLGPWQRLYADRPTPTPDSVLLAVRISRGQAIDVTATASALAGLSAVRSAASQLASDGVDVLLPASAYPAVPVVGCWHSDANGWRRVAHEARWLNAWMDATASIEPS